MKEMPTPLDLHMGRCRTCMEAHFTYPLMFDEDAARSVDCAVVDGGVKSALRILAFSKGKDPAAIVALLELALEGLDEGGHSLPAAHVDRGIHAFISPEMQRAGLDLNRIDTTH